MYSLSTNQILNPGVNYREVNYGREAYRKCTSVQLPVASQFMRVQLCKAQGNSCKKVLEESELPAGDCQRMWKRLCDMVYDGDEHACSDSSLMLIKWYANVPASASVFWHLSASSLAFSLAFSRVSASYCKSTIIKSLCQ